MKSSNEKKKLIALASLVVILGVAIFATFSSDDLQGARRNKRKAKTRTRVTAPAVTTSTQARTPRSGVTAPRTTTTTTGTRNVAPPATPTPPPASTCGNGTIDSGEACDDGNTNNGDGCSETCREEPSQVRFNGLGSPHTAYLMTDKVHISSICTPDTNWEPISQWSMQINKDTILERVKMQTFRQYTGNIQAESLADDYRVLISSNKTDYINTAIGTAEYNTDNTEFIIEFPGNGVSLINNYSTNYNYLTASGTEYYLTLEAKIKESNIFGASHQIWARLIDDGNTSWGTIDEMDFTIDYSSMTAIPGDTYGRWINQDDEAHPDSTCIPIPEVYASLDINRTSNIDSVQIEACTNDTEWHAVYQGTIQANEENLDLNIIPTQVKKMGSGSSGYTGVGEIKAIISTSPDYENTEISNGTYADPTFVSQFGMPVDDVILTAGTTYYVTYLIKLGTNYNGASNRIIVKAFSLNNTYAPYGTFQESNTEADDSNTNLNTIVSPMTPGGTFYWTTCSQ